MISFSFVYYTENCLRITGGVVACFEGNRCGRISLVEDTRKPILLGNVCDLFVKLLLLRLFTTISFCPDAMKQN